MNINGYALRRASAATLAFLLLIISCNENPVTPTATNSTSNPNGKNSASSRITNYTFDGTEGDILNIDTANLWINYYVESGHKVTSVYFSKKVLQSIIGMSGCIGVRFYYSKTETDAPLLIAVGANKNGNDFQSNFRMKGVHSSAGFFEKSSNETYTGTELDSITFETSKAWIDNYLKENPSGIKAHFFGYQIIEQLLSRKDCVGLRCYYALDNNQGVHKLIIIGVSGNGENILSTSTVGGRVTDEGGYAADYSYPCPTYCSGT